MPRVKRGVTSHHRHKKVLSLTKGHHSTKHRLIKRATESMLHSLTYAYFHRRERKGDMRRLWITRINAACRAEGTTYGHIRQHCPVLTSTGKCWRIWPSGSLRALEAWSLSPEGKARPNDSPEKSRVQDSVINPLPSITEGDFFMRGMN